MRRPARWLALALAILLDGAAVAAEDTLDALPAGEGREETFFACTACHGIGFVAQQGLTRDRWEQTMANMVEQNGMPPLDAKEQALVLDYLAKAFPPRRRNRPSPFLR